MANQNKGDTAVANESDANNHNDVDSSGLVDAVSDVSEAFASLPLLLNAGGDGDATAVAVELDASNHNTVDTSGTVDAVDDVAEAFTIFPLLPPELRLMVWEFAMEMEKPRLVHLTARGCGIRRGHRRRGCPRGHGLRLNIYGAVYEQVPIYFFINYECRHLALKYYSIRFSVVQEYSVNPMGPIDRRSTNIIMSPDDILVSWHTNINLQWAAGRYVHIQFGPQAGLVRNLMVHPWRTTYNASTLEMVGRLVEKLNNNEAIEKVYLLRNRGRGPLKYGGNNQRSIEEYKFHRALHDISSRKYRQRLETLKDDNRLEWLYVDAETNMDSQDTDGWTVEIDDLIQ
ncbi:hypothetical protein F4801DRAFT_599168 [Xylaria longipes]|nr:hypothetical protein F4801DRAFT_599168 [Xylaria longipes]